MPKAPVDTVQSTHKDQSIASLKVQSLLEIVAKLRAPDGCPWDRSQTHQSLTQYTIEESFEVVEAIESGDDTKIREELGDLLFQVVLHAQLAQDRGAFNFADIVDSLSEKMIRRHPHVFAGTSVHGTEEIKENWEAIKQAEKATKPKNLHNIFDVPVSLPALQRAYKIGKRTEKLQFDWSNAEQVWEKVEEEHQELREAMDEKSLEEVEHEIGDVLFSIAQLARHLQLEPEQSLRKANQRFEARFVKMKEFIIGDGGNFEKLDLAQKEIYWQKAKQALKKIKN